MRETGSTGLARAYKILVIGPGGAGKSTLSRHLGDILKLEIIHLDQHYWNAGWQETQREEWEETVRGLIGRESWVMDGNYGGTMELRLAAADAVIFLDFPRSTYIPRVFTRRLRYARRSRPDMASGCPERLTFEFFKYLWKYPAERRPGVLRRLEALPDGKTSLILRSPGEVRRLVADLEILTDPRINR